MGFQINITTGWSTLSVGVVYFDQLLGAAHTLTGRTTFFQLFSTFFVNFKPFSVVKKAYFSQHLKSAAPKCWSKHTTTIAREIKQVEYIWIFYNKWRWNTNVLIFGLLRFVLIFWSKSLFFCLAKHSHSTEIMFSFTFLVSESLNEFYFNKILNNVHFWF